MSTNLVVNVHSLLLPIESSSVLLPNAAVAEVLPYVGPEPVPNSEKWLLGKLDWRGCKVPLVSLEVVMGEKHQENADDARVAILYSLNGTKNNPFIAIVLQGLPRLFQASHASVNPHELNSALPQAVLSYAKVKDQQVIIPDLDKLESLVKQYV